MNSEGSIQGETENDMTGTRPEMLLYAEDDDYFAKKIQRALLDIQHKLANKKNNKTDHEDILLQLQAMSNRLDQGVGYDQQNETHRGKSAIEACYLDCNEGTILESDITPAADPSATNSVTIQAETLRRMVKDFSDSMRSEPAIQEHMPMVGSDKLFIQPADPSFTDSMTRLGLCSLQDDIDHDEMAEETSDEEMAVETSDEEMADEAENFARYHRSWEAIWTKTCGSFQHMTSLSSMQFTYYTPRCNPPSSGATTPETLQIFSIKLAEVTGGLGLPLSVYGVVAVRDVVDHNRNFLFYCDRDSSQELTQNDPFLRLNGPSRAVYLQTRSTLKWNYK